MNILQQKMQEENIEIIKRAQFIVSPKAPKILRSTLHSCLSWLLHTSLFATRL